MVIGVPKEIKTLENRVALTPGGVESLVKRGHTVLVERGAGEGSGLSDAEYARAGAELVGREEAWGAEMVVKVKEPLPEEYGFAGGPHPLHLPSPGRGPRPHRGHAP